MGCNDNIYFKNREDAAHKLAQKLPINSMKLEEWIIFASSYGGYEIAKVISQYLDAKYDIILSEKIAAPNNDECEIAVVTEHEEVLINEELISSFDISLDYVYSKSNQIYEDVLSQKVARFRHGKSIQEFKNKNVLIIDEGINTGLTMMACIKTAISLKAKSVSVAVPILPNASIQSIEAIADDLYYIKDLEHFVAISFYYKTLENIKFENLEQK